MRMIAEEKCLWILMLILVIIFTVFKVYDVSLFKSDNLNITFDNITYSIIAAFTFYVLTVFLPKSKTCLKMYQNLYQNVYRIYDMIESTFKLFINDIDKFEQFPERFVAKFVVKKDNEHDKYTVDPFISEALRGMIPKIANMMSTLRSRYSDYLQPEYLLQLDVIEDATSLMTDGLIKEEMKYKEVEALFLQMLSIYFSIKSILNKYKIFAAGQ